MRILIALALLTGHVSHADTKGWEVRLPDHIPIGVGPPGGQISLTIATDRGLTISKDASVIVDVKTDLPIKRKRLLRADAVDPEADAPRFAIPVKADAAGDHLVKVRVRFWVCAARTCKPIDVTKTATVHASLGP